MPTYFTYITTNPNKTVLYTGMTNNLERRIVEHFRNKGSKKSFAGRFYCYNLIYFEEFPRAMHAIEREKEIKDWNRAKKVDLINITNPNWKSLNPTIMEWPPHPDVQSNY